MAEEQLPNQQSKVPKQLQAHVFKKGQSGNPGGRPKGSKSLKQFAKEYLESLPDDEKLDYMEGMDKKIIWEMAEGKAISNIDHTTKGKELPTPLLANVQTNDSTTEGQEPEEKD